MDEVVADLKQLITTELAQQTHELRQGISKVENKVDELSMALAETLDFYSQATDMTLGDHEQRLNKLENQMI